MARWREAVRLDLLPPLVPLDTSQELLLWREVIEEHSQRSGDYNLLRSASAAELASEAAATLDLWQVPLTASLRQQFRLERDCDTFLAWLDAFEKRLSAGQFATTGRCLQALFTAADKLAPTPLVLVACADLSSQG